MSCPAWLFLIVLWAFQVPLLQAQSGAPSTGNEVEFKKLVAQLVAERQKGIEETTAEEPALAILDVIALSFLNAPGETQLVALNQKLASLVSRQPPAGESYIGSPLGGSPAVYAVAANFGSNGPSAVRLYARGRDGYRLAARVDHSSQPDFFDDYLEVVPISLLDVVFVTVTGRTDEFETGMFMAWRWDEGRLLKLWSSDLVPHSSFEAGLDGLRLIYCADSDPDQPGGCRRMTRERYVWEGGAWKRAEQADVPVFLP